jgi:glutamate synthase (NADPH/NADH) large chain
MQQRKGVLDCIKFLRGSPVSTVSQEDITSRAVRPYSVPVTHRVNLLASFGWHDYDMNILTRSALEGKDVIGSMGHQGPLAALMPEDALPNVSDYFKEEVAVVTNPAIDREREAEHFDTSVILGNKPELGSKGLSVVHPIGFVLQKPLLVDAGCLTGFLDQEDICGLSREMGVAVLEDVLDFFSAKGRNPAGLVAIDATHALEEGLKQRVDAICEEVRTAVSNGAALVLLDDTNSFNDRRVFIDPGLLTVRVVKTLEEAGLRRNCSIVVRSGAVRNLHDIMFLLGMGADALSPYLMWQETCNSIEKAGKSEMTCRKAMSNMLDVLQKGIEKVMSTMGIHELCGYGRIFASIGLQEEFAGLFGTRSFFVSTNVGLGFDRLEKQAGMRYELAVS